MKILLAKFKKVGIGSLSTLLLLTAASINTYASNDQSEGAVHFSGSVIFPPCFNEVTDSHVSLNCLNGQLDMVANKIDLNDVTKTQGWKVINDGRGEYSYNWMNEDKKLGMLTIKYI